MRILVVEDTIDIAANIGDYLEIKGHEVDFAYHGQAALALLKQSQFDVIVLDIMMPGIDGLTLCKLLRNQFCLDIPILFLTARDSLEDKLTGFEVGGDDYLVKPFALEELHCRLQALCTRGRRKIRKTLCYGPLTIDPNAMSASCAGQALRLDPIQFDILKLLLQNAPVLVTKEDIEYAIWQGDAGESSALRTHIYRLRSALNDDLIETVHGKGYRIREC